MDWKQKIIFSLLFNKQVLVRSGLIFLMCAASNVAFSICPTPFISSTSNTFGVSICSSPSVPSRYHSHAENVLHNLLDYNDDLVPDNKKVLTEMLSNQAVFLVLSEEEQLELYERKSGDHFNFTVVYTEEMALNDVSQFDATIEEALHLVTAEGYSKAYPDFFGEFQGSKISTFLDIARGGNFSKVPKKYPSKAYFTYYDRTCDYGCQITEFLYWAITTLRGQQKHYWRDSEIEEEWMPETTEKLLKLDPDLVEFLSKKEFAILY